MDIELHNTIVTDIVDTVLNAHRFEDKLAFILSSEADLIKYHHTIGEYVRNRWHLWSYKWTPELVDGCDMSPHHPDAVSMNLIKCAWSQLRSMPKYSLLVSAYENLSDPG